MAEEEKNVVIGKVSELGEIRSGISENGNEWESRLVVVDGFLGRGGKLFPIEFFGKEKVDMTRDLEIGQLVEMTFGIETRKHDGKHYVKLGGRTIKKYQLTEEQQAKTHRDAEGNPIEPE